MLYSKKQKQRMKNEKNMIEKYLIPEYRLGEWINDSYLIDVWSSNTLLMRDYIESIGFCYLSKIKFGSELTHEIEIYESANKFLDVFLGSFSTMDSTNFFYIPDFQSYMCFLKEYKSVFEEKKPQFIQVNDFLLNKDHIVKIKIVDYPQSESVYIHLSDDDDEHIEKCFVKINHNEKFHGGNADIWLEENF